MNYGRLNYKEPRLVDKRNIEEILHLISFDLTEHQVKLMERQT
jgi:hypothetical protein